LAQNRWVSWDSIFSIHSFKELIILRKFRHGFACYMSSKWLLFLSICRNFTNNFLNALELWNNILPTCSNATFMAYLTGTASCLLQCNYNLYVAMYLFLILCGKAFDLHFVFCCSSICMFIRALCTCVYTHICTYTCVCTYVRTCTGIYSIIMQFSFLFLKHTHTFILYSKNVYLKFCILIIFVLFDFLFLNYYVIKFKCIWFCLRKLCQSAK